MSNLWLNDAAPCQLFKDKELQLLMSDKRVHYNALNCILFGSSYFCHKILPKQIIFENLIPTKGVQSRMMSDMEKFFQ